MAGIRKESAPSMTGHTQHDLVQDAAKVSNRTLGNMSLDFPVADHQHRATELRAYVPVA